MKPLTRRHAVRLTHERFRADTQSLITALQRALEGAEDGRAGRAAAAPQAKSEHQRLRRQAGGLRIFALLIVAAFAAAVLLVVILGHH